MTTGIAGGHAGRWIVEALAAEGLDPHWAPAAAESRTTYVTVDARRRRRSSSTSGPRRPRDEEFAAFLRLLEDELLPAQRAGHRGRQRAGRRRGLRARRHRGGLPPCRLPAPRGRLRPGPAGGPGGRAGRRQGRDARRSSRPGSSTPRGRLAKRRPRRSSSTAPTLAVVTDGRAAGRGRRRRARWRSTCRAWRPSTRSARAIRSTPPSRWRSWTVPRMETALARGVAAGSANALALGAGMLDPLEARRAGSARSG